MDNLEKGCPYSFSEELILNDMLKSIVEELNEELSRKSLPEKKISQLLAVKARAEEILAGPCCQIIRSIEKTQEIIFGIQKEFKTPSY